MGEYWPLMFCGNLPKIKILWYFEIVPNTGAYRLEVQKATPHTVFMMISVKVVHFMRTPATMGECRLLHFLAISQT